MGETLTNRRNWREKLVEELRAYAIISAYFLFALAQ